MVMKQIKEIVIANTIALGINAYQPKCLRGAYRNIRGTTLNGIYTLKKPAQAQ